MTTVNSSLPYSPVSEGQHTPQQRSFGQATCDSIKTALKVSFAALAVIISYGAIITAIGCALTFGSKLGLSTLAHDFMISTITGAGLATVLSFKNPIELFKVYYGAFDSKSSQKAKEDKEEKKKAGVVIENPSLTLHVTTDAKPSQVKNRRFKGFRAPKSPFTKV